MPIAAKIEHTIGVFGARATQAARAVPMILAALSTYHAGITQVVIAGEHHASLGDVLRRRYLPNAVIVPVAERTREDLVRVLPWVDGMSSREGQATAYVCRDFACQMPATSAEQLDRQIESLERLAR